MKRRPLLFALTANALFLAVEIVGGLLFGSLTVLADAAHMTSDVLALTIAFIALVLAQRPPTERHTFGFARAEVLAAQVNGVLLLGAAGIIVWEAVRRLGEPHAIDAAGVLVIGVLGLLVNAGSALGLSHVSHGDVNLRAAFWHLTADAAGSVAVIVTAIGVIAFDAEWLDPIASLLIAALVVVAAWRLLRDTTQVLLEAVPSGVDIAAVRDAIEGSAGVEAVHHLHVWTMGSAQSALSAHVVLAGELSLHEAQERSTAMKTMLLTGFGIGHATIEVECHTCDDDVAAHH